MAIEAYLDNLRTKPEHVRRRFAFWWALALTALIAIFWFGSITGFSLSKNAAVASATQKISSPGQALVAGIGSLGKDVWELVFGPKKVVYSEVEVLPGK